MSQISSAGSFGSINWLQGQGTVINSSASNGVNAGSSLTITEESFAIVDINFSGAPLSGVSPTSTATSSDPSSSSGASTTDPSNSAASNSGTTSSQSSLFADLLNQIQTALQSVLQALEGNTAGGSANSGAPSATSTNSSSTDATGTGATDPAATGAGSTSSSDPSNTTLSNTTSPDATSSDATAGTDQTGSTSNTPANAGQTTEVIVAAISIESVEVTPAGKSLATSAPTDSNATGNTHSSNKDLQLLQQVFSALGNVFQQNGLGSSQTSNGSQSPLANFLNQNGLTPHQFTNELFSSLQQNGGRGFSLGHIFQNAQSGQNLNLFG